MHTFYLDHHGWLQSWLRRQIGCAHQAADLSQDTFERLLRGLSSEPLREPRAFLATVARRVLFEHWRRRDLEHAYLEALTAFSSDANSPSAEECAAVLQVLSRLDAVLYGLGPRVRQVFLLNQLEDKSYREIAEEVGMPVISVRRAMSKAIAACCALSQA